MSAELHASDSSVASEGSHACAKHTVQLYDHDDTLIDALTGFAVEALRAGKAVLVLAIEAHRLALRERLQEAGIDVDAALVRGDLVMLDAAALLARIMVGASPDRERFHEMIGEVFDQATVANGQPREVAIFGELVALLSAEGNHQAAIALEHLWNSLAQTRDFTLFCAYPMSAFPGSDDSGPLGEICAAHNGVVPAEPRPARPEHNGHLGTIAVLQQKARALEHEIAKRKRTESQLQRHQELLAAIVESSDDAIISKALDGTITSWNPAAERLYGYTAEEMIGRSIATIVPPERLTELADILARLGRGERIAHHETERVRRDGSRVEVSLTISPIHDEFGRVIGASKITRDISDRRALERQKQEFLEMVAHDLGSPMTVVKGYAQLLQRRQAYDERAVSAIVDRAAQMGRLVADMLEMTRLEAGRLELRRAAVDLTDIARACAAQASLLANGRSVEVRAPAEPIVGAWDGDRLAQVLTNLLDNALKFAPEGDVVVEVRALPDVARVAVIDQGPGLEPEELPRIFEHFFRAPRTASATAGAGLGLYICKALVEAHGGWLWAESTPGQGSTFVCDLPYLAAQPDVLTTENGFAQA